MIPSILTIGNFDGVHIGHRQLIATTIALARSWCGRAVALTFSPHPRQYFSPSDHFYIYPPEVKNKILSGLGLDEILYLPFGDICALSPEDFFNTILLPLNPAAIVLGDNFTFGAGKSGNLDMLRRFCADHDVALHSLCMTIYEGKPVSSSRIRAAIQNGEIQLAGSLLGQPYTLYGLVEHGAGRGHQLGFATANIRPKTQVLPKIGVYASRVRIDGESALPSVTAVTQTPTFGQVETQVETHILDYDSELYGHKIAVELLGYLRGERSFDTPDALKMQLRLDCDMARSFDG